MLQAVIRQSATVKAGPVMAQSGPGAPTLVRVAADADLVVVKVRLCARDAVVLPGAVHLRGSCRVRIGVRVGVRVGAGIDAQQSQQQNPVNIISPKISNPEVLIVLSSPWICNTRAGEVVL